VPTRYPGTEAIEDDALRLARRTEWVEAGAGSFVGQGQRILTTDGGEFALMDLRRVDLEPADVPAATAPGAEASGG
jgi:type VI secretion system protein ImpE